MNTTTTNNNSGRSGSSTNSSSGIDQDKTNETELVRGTSSDTATVIEEYSSSSITNHNTNTIGRSVPVVVEGGGRGIVATTPTPSRQQYPQPFEIIHC